MRLLQGLFESKIELARVMLELHLTDLVVNVLRIVTSLAHRQLSLILFNSLLLDLLLDGDRGTL